MVGPCALGCLLAGQALPGTQCLVGLWGTAQLAGVRLSPRVVVVRGLLGLYCSGCRKALVQAEASQGWLAAGGPGTGSPYAEGTSSSA